MRDYAMGVWQGGYALKKSSVVLFRAELVLQIRIRLVTAYHPSLTKACIPGTEYK